MNLKPTVCQIFLLITLITVVEPGYGATQSAEKQIPLAVGEMTDLLVKWWEDAGYRIRRMEPEAGHVTLNAIKDQESWQVDLSPHSALETRVSATYSGKTPDLRQRQFWDHISSYLLSLPTEAPPGSNHPIPAAVLSRIESVVCINARSDETSIQFSGVIIDTNGIVLCTAHDLGNSQHITVTLYDGQEVTAKLLLKDPHADLSILQLSLKPKAAIRLSEGRNLLEMGETIFSVGCPVNLQNIIYAGTINAPPRRMNDLPLWQANMEIHHGSSGSPVFDVNGNIVAVVKGRYRGTTTTGFLIPLETILHFLKEKSPL